MADFNAMRTAAGARASEIDEGLRAHMNKVYGTMSIGLLITGLTAWAIAGLSVTAEPSAYALREGQYLTSFGTALFASPLKWLVMFGPLAFILFGWGTLISKCSASIVQLGFFVFSMAMGASMSSIFLVFTGASIFQTFLITAIAFASLSLWGYTTKKDLSGWGSFLMMGVIGLILAMVVNLILGSFFGINSPGLMFAISAIGVLVFAGLTAFYTQEIKTTYIAHANHGDQEWLDKAAYDGALSLYISFLNMFQFLLMFMGSQE